MVDYPDFCILADSYEPEVADGSELMRAESGEAWIYRSYDKEQITFSIVHPALKADEEEELRTFYRTHKRERVRFLNPRDGKYYSVLMASPPRLTTMRSGLLANVGMTLVGVLDE